MASRTQPKQSAQAAKTTTKDTAAKTNVTDIAKKAKTNGNGNGHAKTDNLPARTGQNKAPATVAIDQDLLNDMEADSQGEGLEEADRDSFAIPFLTILQDLSPQVKSLKPEYIPEAKVGQLFQTVTHELYDELRVIPCYFSRIFIEWVPRDQGGGIAGIYDNATGQKMQKDCERDGGKFMMKNGNELSDTRQHFVIIYDPNGDGSDAQQVLMAMRSSGIKHSKKWNFVQNGAVETNSAGKLFKPKPFACSYRITTKEEANDEGQWFNWNIDDRTRLDPKSARDQRLFKLAQGFYAAMHSNSAAVKVNYEDLQSQVDTNPMSGPGDAPGDLDNEIDA